VHEEGRRTGRGLTLGAAVGLLAFGIGAIVGSTALSDNSFLTHLATGRIIWDGGGIPREDPYTFTAAGESWVVQSWFASVIYGGIEKALDLGALRVLMAATMGGLAVLTWTLTRRAQTLAGRLLVFAPALVAGAGSWAERPLLFGLLGLGAALLAAESRLDPRWLLPVGWFWVNTHGSWPLGVVALACLALGRRMDGEAPAAELRALLWLGLGFVAAVVNPYGLRLLLFPAHLLSRRESLDGIIEWGPMTFGGIEEWAFLLLVAVGIASVCRRPAWRSAVPLVIFSALAFTGVRNVPVAALVLLPGAASGLAGIGSVRGDRPSALARPLAVLGLVLALVAVGSIARTDDFDDEPFPIAAENWLRDNDLDPRSHRIIAREFVGNWLEAVYGPTGQVWMDDRIEVIPAAVVEDHRRLLRGAPNWEAVLASYQPDAVLWEADSPLASILVESEEWSIDYRDDDWIVATPASGAN
jgi:hypothetical protein